MNLSDSKSQGWQDAFPGATKRTGSAIQGSCFHSLRKTGAGQYFTVAISSSYPLKKERIHMTVFLLLPAVPYLCISFSPQDILWGEHWCHYHLTGEEIMTQGRWSRLLTQLPEPGADMLFATLCLSLLREGFLLNPKCLPPRGSLTRLKHRDSLPLSCPAFPDLLTYQITWVEMEEDALTKLDEHLLIIKGFLCA